MPAQYMAVSRSWLIVLMAVVVAPWFAVASIWIRPANKMEVDAENEPPAKAVLTGKWGNLTLAPIVISPPKELILKDWGFFPRPTWFFPGANAGRAARMLQSAGVSATEAAMLRAEAKTEPRITGVVIQPDPAWVRALLPETRASIYRMLGRSWLNVDQTLAFRYPGINADAWLDSSLISQRTKQLIEPLLYRDGGYLLFSDISVVREEIGSDEELRRLGKALCRQPTVIARLSVGNPADVEALVEYWGRGGRRTEVRPLLESIAGGGPNRFIDVTYLLPAFARNHLYSYPHTSSADLGQKAAVNCLWTSLNFFNSIPDNRFLDAGVALKTLKKDYSIVESDFQLGDIVELLDEDGDIFHAVVYIAGDLVFSKNGMSRTTPWMLMSLDEVKGFYRWRSQNPRLVYHRRKDLQES